MTATLIIAGLTVGAIITSVLFKPQIKIGKVRLDTYWIVALIGAVLLVVCRQLPLLEFFEGITANSSVNPLKILTLFLSVTFISVFLDEAGFFKYLAALTLKKAGASRLKLFIYLYVIVSVLTVFTSNDIIVLTFTPFICYFCKRAGINPLPYLLAEFTAANTWSLMLIIGNPTNIYIASAAGIDFISYFLVMWLPATFAGVSSFLVLLKLFFKQLKKPIETFGDDYTIEKPDMPMTVTGLIHLILSTVLLVISSYIHFEMWAITLFFAVSLCLCALIISLLRGKRPGALLKGLKRSPWQLIPFVLSMFALITSLSLCGFTVVFAQFLNIFPPILSYGLGSFFVSNIVNNIPMSVLFSSMVNTLGGAAGFNAAYASVIGSNLGAILSPIGALAGIMWSNILKKHEVKFSFLTFMKYGVLISLPALFCALGGLALLQI